MLEYIKINILAKLFCQNSGYIIKRNFESFSILKWALKNIIRIGYNSSSLFFY
jgi:hypothetical protein